MAQGIAVLDLAAFRAGGPPAAGFAEALSSACETAGVFSICNHGIDDALDASLMDQSKAFFALDEGIKNRLAVTQERYGGYIPPALGTADDSDLSGLCERYRMHLELSDDDPMMAARVPLYGANVWPPAMPNFERAMSRCFDAMCAVSVDLLRGLALALHVDSKVFVPFFENPLSTFTVVRCPSERTNADGHEKTVRPSHDSCAFTILLSDPGGGIEVSPSDGALIVVIGNMMEAWSGGRLVSGSHRTAGLAGEASHQFVFSAIPNYGTIIRPLPGFGSNYRPVHVGPYMEAFYRQRP